MIRKVSIGGVIPCSAVTFAGHGREADFAAVRVRQHEPTTLPPEADLSNVLMFVRGGDGARAPKIELPDDIAAAHRSHFAEGQAHRAVFTALSVAIHGGLAMLLWHEPPPLASIGTEVISVEITLGATAPAGIATTPGESETQSASAPDDKPTETEQAEQKATDQPQDVQVAEKETAPEVKTETPPDKTAAADATPTPDEAPSETANTAPAETTPAETPVAQTPPQEPKPSVAMVETPEADTATAKPTEPPPDAVTFSMLPPPQTKPIEPVRKKQPEAKPKRTPPKPAKQAEPSKERRRLDAPTRAKPTQDARASRASNRANNVGVGHSSNDTNYRGLVAAHLARHKQYPAAARSRGDQGTATVNFSLDGAGRVTSVRLVRGSGFGSIDAEVTAMVRRASPFPAPPSKQSVNFTVPVSFRIN